MSIHNITASTFDHVCSAPGCQHSRQGLLHSTLHPDMVDHPVHGKIICIICPGGHVECLNNALEAWEETSPTRDEASREQVRNVRALHRHLGLPVK